MAMNILITTGVYPPKIGGPSQYAQNLGEAFEKMKHSVSIKTFTVENYLPSGVRHLLFFFKIISKIIESDVVFVLDTFSVGLPSVLACKIFGKKCVIRTGGDFLWEQYVERTGRKILLKNFYNTERHLFSFKEKIIFRLTKWTLNNASKIIFSTEWQKNIFLEAYNLKEANTRVVENYYGPKELSRDFESKTFVASTRKLVWKNSDFLKRVFEKIKAQDSGIILFTDNLPYQKLIEKMKNCYSVILISLGDISPNMILDAIRLNKPFICTEEIGIYHRIKNAGIFVNPLDEKEIEEAILNLLTEKGYKEAKEKVKNFNFLHSWRDIAGEFIKVYNSI